MTFHISPLCVYSVKDLESADGEETFGMLYYAEIEEFEKELHSEIEKIIITDELVNDWTYKTAFVDRGNSGNNYGQTFSINDIRQLCSLLNL